MTDRLLLADGSSFVLQTNGSDHVLLAADSSIIAGVRSLFAFWAGGASAVGEAVIARRGVGRPGRKRRRQTREEILAEFAQEEREHHDQHAALLAAITRARGGTVPEPSREVEIADYLAAQQRLDEQRDQRVASRIAQAKSDDERALLRVLMADAESASRLSAALAESDRAFRRALAAEIARQEEDEDDILMLLNA